MTNELVQAGDVCDAIDRVVAEVSPIQRKGVETMRDAFQLASGCQALREIFYNNADIKDMIGSMMNSRLGFMTDRTPENLQWNKKLKPYEYRTIADCCIDAMLNGYRLTGNEFNIIAGNFYAAKAGKYRRIIENPIVTDFKFSHTAPEYDAAVRIIGGRKEQIPYASIRCFASWKQDGQLQKMGYTQGDEQVFKIKVNKFMGDDGVIGKALSKLFSRVLMRLEGRIEQEAEDVDARGDIIDVTPPAGSTGSAETKIDESGQNRAENEQKTAENEQKTQKPDTASWAMEFRDEWVHKNKPGYQVFIRRNIDNFIRLKADDPAIYTEAVEKWERFYPDEDWPIKQTVSEDRQKELDRRDRIREAANGMPDNGNGANSDNGQDDDPDPNDPMAELNLHRRELMRLRAEGAVDERGQKIFIMAMKSKGMEGREAVDLSIDECLALKDEYFSLLELNDRVS